MEKPQARREGELVQLVRQLLTLHPGETLLGAHHLPPRIGPNDPQHISVSGKVLPRPAAPSASEPVELPALLAALRAAGGNVTRAAAMLGISRQRAYRLMESHAVDLNALRGQEGEPH